MADRHLVDVHVLLVGGERVLLTRRRDADPRFDGGWQLPAGKLAAGESVLAAACREVAEEVGVALDPAELRHVHTAHVVAAGLPGRIGLFFRASRWRGEPVNREPDACSGLGWFRLDELPRGLIDYAAAGIAGYRAGRSFGLLGWPGGQP